MIRAIVDDELANRPLTASQKRWIGMVSELSIDTSQDITGHVVVQSEAALGRATIKLLDHHRVALATRTQAIQPGETVFAFRRKSKVGALYLQIGAFRDWVVSDAYGGIADEWGRSDDESTP